MKPMSVITLPPRHTIASFDVDCQNAFTPLCPAELPVPDGHTIVSELNAQARYAAYRLASKDAHSPQALWIATRDQPQLSQIAGANVDVRWVPHAIPGTQGFALIDGLPTITEYDFFVWKGIELDMHPYGSCYHDLAEKLSTGVIEFLRSKQVTTVLLGGLAIEYCVKATVMQLLRANFTVIVNRAACRGFAAADAAMQEMQQHGATIVESVIQLLSEG